MIRLQGISKTFNKGTALETEALKHTDISIESGQYTVVVGPNGCGKSTLLNLIAGNMFPDRGQIFFDNLDVTGLPDYRRSPYVARLFQNPLHGSAPDLSIIENFRLAALRTGRKSLRIGITAGFRRSAAELISRLGMGLESRLDRPMGTLSGGQRQALTLLMGTMDECRILLMDEPTSALDPRSSALIMELADSVIREKALTALLVTHHLRDSISFGNRLLMMDEGCVVRDFAAQEKSALKPEDVSGWFNR